MSGEQSNKEGLNDEILSHLRTDPIIEFLTKVEISDALLNDMATQCQTLEGFKKFYRATDLFIIREILVQVDVWEPENDNPNYIAFRNLMKWFMYLIATHPWWHRKLCYYNRMMGVNTHSSSYYRLQYHPGYVPGDHWRNEDMDTKPEQFNSEQMPAKQMFDWIDKNVTDKLNNDEEIDDEDILKLSDKIVTSKQKTNPIKPRKKRR